MTDLDNILNTVCEEVGVEREKIADRRRINERHQMARIVYCRVAFGYLPYDDIGRKINRSRKSVCYNINYAKTNRIIEYAIKEVRSKLKKENI